MEPVHRQPRRNDSGIILMPKLIGLRNSNFDPQRYLAGFGENGREGEITTVSIISRIDAMNDAIGDKLAASIKSSPMFIKSKPST